MPHPWETPHYPTCDCCPPYFLQDYIFTAVAEEHAKPPEDPYQTAGGTTVNLTIRDEYMMAQICHYAMTHTADSLYYADTIKPTKKQYGLKAGLCAFADCGSNAIVKELTQFHTLKYFKPRDPFTLIRVNCPNALTSLMFLKEKNTGDVKCRNSG
jgi:hypothetical protein